MRRFFQLCAFMALGFSIYSCETRCSEDVCPGTSVNLKFRYVDTEGNDLVFGPDSIRLFHPDSVMMIAQNPEAISFEQIILKSLSTSDTSGYLQGGISAKHNRFFIMAMDSALFVADSLVVDSLLIDSIYYLKPVSSTDTIISGYVTESSECCAGLIKRFDIIISGQDTCNDCSENKMHLLVKNRDSL